MGKAKKEVHADDDDAIFAQRAIELKGASPQEVPYPIFDAIRAPTAVRVRLLFLHPISTRSSRRDLNAVSRGVPPAT